MPNRFLAIASVAAVLVFPLEAGWTMPALAASAKPQAAKQEAPAPGLKTGDLVRLRSGGPLMTVDKVEGDLVTCFWSTEYGDVRSGSFRIAELALPITLPTPDPDLKKDEAATDRYYREHCPGGFITFEGKFRCAD
jgi:uncharacterized protein YodC (DUF2158 family)